MGLAAPRSDGDGDSDGEADGGRTAPYQTSSGVRCGRRRPRSRRRLAVLYRSGHVMGFWLKGYYM